MRPRNLTLAILFGLGIANTPLLIAPAQAEETQASLEQVKARISTFDDLITQASNRYLKTTPTIESIKISTSDYQNTANGADARTTLTIDFSPRYLKQGEPKTFNLSFADTITINDELQSKGIIAHIERKIIVDDELKKVLDLDDQDIKKISHGLQYLEMSLDLLPEGEVKQVVKVTPFEFEQDGTTVKFAGLVVNSEENEATLINNVGKVHAEINQLDITSDSDTFVLEPFKFDYSLNEDGDLKLSTSPIKVIANKSPENKMELTIKRISGKGDDVVFDERIGGFTGKEEYVLDTIQITNTNAPAPITIDSVRIHSDVHKNSDLYNFNNGLVIDFDGESISKVIGIDGLEFEDSKINFQASDISAHTMQTINYLYAAIGALQPDEHQDDSASANQGNQKFYDEIKERSKTLLDDLSKNQSSFKVNIDFDTDQGDATFVANIKVKKDAVTDVAQWQAAFEAQQPTHMIGLLQRSLDFDIKFSVPESLLNATGLTPMVSMGAGFIVKDGSNYTLHIENTSDGIELNGNIIPLPSK